jgi:hypothetical protein
LFIDSQSQKYSDKARLISPVQAKTAGSCIHFYYHAYGKIDQSILNILNLIELTEKKEETSEN